MKIKLFKGAYSAVAIFLGLAILAFIIVNQSDEVNEPENQTKATIEI